MRTLSLVCITFLTLMSTALRLAHAQEAPADPLTVFQQAGELYQKGSFDKAAALYESLAADGQVNAALWYNLGNTYYRAQRPGMALVAYARAQRLAPRDQDIRHNIDFIRQQAGEPEPGFSSYLISLPEQIASLNEVAIAFTIFLWLAALCGTLWLFRRQRWALWGTTIACVGTVLCGSLLALKVNNEIIVRHAVVTTGPIEVRNGPDQNETVGFSLPEGRSVIILSEQGEWSAIGVTAEGFRGWLPSRNIQKI